MPQPQLSNDPDYNKIKIQLEVCSQETEHLYDWEVNMLESYSDQFDRNGTLTRPQQICLQKMYDKVV